MKVEELKTYLHQRGLSRRDSLLILLASFDEPCQIKEMKSRAESVGLREIKKWNPSDILNRAKGYAILTDLGWEITVPGKQYLYDRGLLTNNPGPDSVAHALRAKLPNINDHQTRDFVEEAIRCHEHDCNRAAVVMSWQAAIHVLHTHVFYNHLAAFNTEAKRVNSKWKQAVHPDDFGRIKEKDFLDLLVPIGVLGKDVKQELQKALDFRNHCSHPNSFKIGRNNVASHIETLLLNVFNRFQ